MIPVKAIAATSASEPLEPVTIKRRELEAHDVLIEIAFTGICTRTSIMSVAIGAPSNIRWSQATKSRASSLALGVPSQGTPLATASASAAWLTRAGSVRIV